MEMQSNRCWQEMPLVESIGTRPNRRNAGWRKLFFCVHMSVVLNVDEKMGRWILALFAQR
jgi:hypothetical protein